MGKEIRVGLSVVGILLLLFCVLLYGRLSRRFLGPSPDVFIEATSTSSEEGSSSSTAQPGVVRSQPTIVLDNAYDEPVRNPRLESEHKD